MHFSNPQSHVLQMGLTSGMQVLDVGTGSGHFALALHHVVAPDGRVHALDIQEDILTRLWHEARKRGMHGIQTHWADAHALPFESETMDAVVLSSVLHQTEDVERVLTEGVRVLRPGGKLFVSDWQESFGHIGPHPEKVVQKNFIEKLLEKFPLAKQKDIDAGEFHYSILYTKDIP